MNRRAKVLGVELDRLDIDAAVERCISVIEDRASTHHMSVNVAKLVALRSDERMRRIVEEADLVTADGMPVVWASRLLGDRLPARVAGIDLMNCLLHQAEERGFSVYILGARQEVLDRAVQRIRERHPRLVIAGFRNGYFAEDEASDVAAEIRAAKPDIVFVAMSSPRKEYWIDEHRGSLDVPFVMGVGGAIDIWAGVTRRAPLVMQRAGLEWLFRMLQEPRRMSSRYAGTNLRFSLLLVRAMASRLKARLAGV